MDIARARKWIEYFIIINGTNKQEDETDENNVAGFMQFLQNNKG